MRQHPPFGVGVRSLSEVLANLGGSTGRTITFMIVVSES